MATIIRSLLLCSLLIQNAVAADSTLSLKKIHDNVYAIFGQLGDRNKDNFGNNANFGFVITDDGIVLIDSGASLKGAQAIHAVIKTISDKPVTTVINTGGQDHRWLGNDYFRQHGARIIANKAAVSDHKARASAQLENLGNALGADNLDGTKPAFADTQFESSYAFTAGKTRIQIRHTGAAHTPGDSFVWLPESGIVFSGDIIYTQRMLGVIPVSNSKNWLAAFEAIQALKPATVIPGHGETTDLNSAVKDTYNYLVFLRNAVQRFMDEGNGIEQISEIQQADFSYLKNYEALKGRNAQKVFSEMEWE